MKKILYFLFFVSAFTINTRAQVAIGSQEAPQRGAVLELKSDTLGFLPPRVALSGLSKPNPLPLHVKGMVVFNTINNLSDTLQIGLYYNTGTRWIRLSTAPGWFYMPSVVFDTSTPGTNLTMDLYEAYKKQLTGPQAKNPDAPNFISYLPKATDLNYYISDYDNQVFEIKSISNTGVLTYSIKKAATDATFINIVFVEK